MNTSAAPSDHGSFKNGYRGSPGELAVADAQPGTRFILITGKPYGETPIFTGPYVD